MKVSIVTLFFVLYTLVSFGQENSSYRSSLMKLIQISGSELAYKGAVSQMISMFKQQQSNVPEEFWNELSAEMNRDVTNQLLNLLVPVYQKHLTEQDILGVVAFYKTPVGKKFAEKTPLITQESMTAGQEWGKEIGLKIVQKLKEKGYNQN